MSMGSDYAAGYGLGMRQNQADLSRLQSVIGTAGAGGGRVVSGGGGVVRGGAPSASELRAKAMEQALARRERELELREKEQKMRQDELEAQSVRNLRDTRAQTLQAQQQEAERQAEDQRIRGLEEDARRYKAEHKEYAQESKRRMLENAIQGLYLGESDSVKQFFDVHGAPGVSIEGVKRTPKGQVQVHYGQGKTSTFKNPAEAVKTLLMPAAAIAAGAGAEEKKQATGITAKEKADLTLEFINSFTKNTGQVPTGEQVEQAKQRMGIRTEKREPPGGEKPREDHYKILYNKKTGEYHKIFKNHIEVYSSDKKYLKTIPKDDQRQAKGITSDKGKVPAHNFFEKEEEGEKVRYYIQGDKIVKYKKNEEGKWEPAQDTEEDDDKKKKEKEKDKRNDSFSKAPKKVKYSRVNSAPKVTGSIK